MRIWRSIFRVPWLIAPALFGLWIIADLELPCHSSLTSFDAHEVARLETDVWRAYYGHQPARLYERLTDLLRHQYHLPFWRAHAAAWDAAHASVVFQRGRVRAEYELALPALLNYYAIIRRSSDAPFPVEKTAQLELEWWIIHRERGQHAPSDLERSMALLESTIYQRPQSLFLEHAHARAQAMLLRDAAAARGAVSDQDWARIGALLDESWMSLKEAVTHKQISAAENSASRIRLHRDIRSDNVVKQ